MLRNRKEVNAGNLDGVHRDANTIKLKLGTFQTLTNWTAAGIGSIKKKRGVEILLGTPTPPTPPGGGVCPDSPEQTGIHTGFTFIGVDSAVVYRATNPIHNYAAYRGSLGGDPFLTTFDMDDMTVLADGNGNGYYINADPAIDNVNGDLYAFRRTLVGSNVRLGIWDKSTLALISEGPDFALVGSSITDLKIGTNFIYAATTLFRVLIFDKATLTLQHTVNPSDFNHRVGSITVDDNDNAWGMTRQSGGASTENRLMKIDSGGSVTSYDVTADMGAPTLNPRTMFDVSTNSIICWNSGTHTLGKFDIGATSILTTVSTLGWIAIEAEMNNYPYNGTFWHGVFNGFVEFDIATMADVPANTYSFTDVVGAHASATIARYVWMPSLQCLHAAHGAVSGLAPNGGVDRICLPCP